MGFRISSSNSARAFETDKFKWNLGRVPKTLKFADKEIEHPARSCGVFVVHGIGEQKWTETSASLRSGFEDAISLIRKERKKTVGPQGNAGHASLCGNRCEAFEAQGPPPPFVLDGYWANYADLSETFPEDWKKFSEREQHFFSKVWQKRVLSPVSTFLWFLLQQLRLLNPILTGWAWPLYVVAQPIIFFGILATLIRHPKLMTGYLEDVRLYLCPKGIVERAIVQRIDYRVGRSFLKMIGLNWDFLPLDDHEKISISDSPHEFKRIIWVAHSLGTVISYNVLSDLFARTHELDDSGTPQQKKGVEKFRQSLRRFVTMGSPLDKIAVLFGEKSLRYWGALETEKPRDSFLSGGETMGEDTREWWVNFYHTLDPVSGALNNNAVCGNDAPANFHIGLIKVPVWAHISYWSDLRPLRFILARTFGKENIPDQSYKPYSAKTLLFMGILGYATWSTLLLGAIATLAIWGHSLFHGKSFIVVLQTLLKLVQ